jgi:hypothetical protein
MSARLTTVAARVLARAAKLLPRDRREWLEALVAECDQVESGPSRRRWIAGGAWFLLRRLAGEPRWTMPAAVVATVGLVGVNIARYPELVSQSPLTAAVFLSLFALLVTGYGWQIRVMLRRGDAELVRQTVRLGMLAGALLLTAMALANIDQVRHRWPVAVELGEGGGAALAFVVAGRIWARAAGRLGVAVRGGIYAGITAGLTVFLGIVGLSMAFVSPADGAPANTPLRVRQDPHALALAAAGDMLSGAINLLALVPLMAALVCGLAALISRASRA